MTTRHQAEAEEDAFNDRARDRVASFYLTDDEIDDLCTCDETPDLCPIHGWTTADYARSVAAIHDALTSAIDRVDEVFNTYFTEASIWLMPRGRARRRLRKKAQLVAHYQRKLDRIPTWKRATR